MRLDQAFRLSSFLTLAAACACLGYAALPFLPEILYLAPVVLALLLIAYLTEGRWTMTDRFTNLVATPVIAVGVGAWATCRMADPLRGPAEGPVFWVLMGSFLMLSKLLMLFRVKRGQDFWFPHLTAFIAVAISCALDSDLFFALLLLGYLMCGGWSLALYYLAAQALGQAASVRPLNEASAADRSFMELTPPARRAEPGVAVPWRFLGLCQASRRTLVVAGLALVLFLVTPRQGNTRWDVSLLDMPNLQTLAVDPGINLYHTGTVRLSKAVVFQVEAVDAEGNPKTDLPADQRWRGSALDTYARGRCFNLAAVAPQAHPPVSPSFERLPADPNRALPPLGPRQYFLTFTFVNRPLHRVCVAEPVTFTPPAGRLPLVFLTDSKNPVPLAHHLNTEVPPPLLDRHQKCAYRQVAVPMPDPELTPAVDVERLLQGPLSRPPDVPGLREWTAQLLDRLAREGKVEPRAIETNEQGGLLPEHHETVARALEDHLARSGEYTYTLQLSRRDAGLDPVLDFLSNVKAGHCQRFATGLTAMLRSVGIPARIVVGYRGGDHRGDGVYRVRQCDAHSWAEVLVRRPGPAGHVAWYWRTLDPTPGSDVGTGAGAGWQGWWRALRNGGEMWRSFVVDYNAEQQEATMLELWKYTGDPARFRLDGGRFGSPTVWALTVGLVGLAVLWRRLRQRRRGLQPGRRSPGLALSGDTAFYGRLLAVLARRCRRSPEAGQTPREFAEAVGRLIRATAGESLADIPVWLTRLYYRVRFAGQPLEAAEVDEVQRRIAELDAGLVRAAREA